MIKLLVSLNWAVGSILLAVAFSAPFLDQIIFFPMIEGELESLVSNYRSSQYEYFKTYNRFLDFGFFEKNETEKLAKNGEKNIADSRFMLDGSYLPEGGFRLRGITSPDGLKAGTPPLHYEIRIETFLEGKVKNHKFTAVWKLKGRRRTWLDLFL